MADLLLTNKEIKDLTGLSHKSRQFTWLSQNGFFAKQKANGEIIISREHVNTVLNPALKQRPKAEPDFNNLD